MKSVIPLGVQALSEGNWEALEKLFGANGGCGGCWCMNYRCEKIAFESGKGKINRSRLKDLVSAGYPTGLLLFWGNEAIAWVSVAPRTQFPRLEKSRLLKSGTSGQVWSVTCLFVRKDFRGQNIGRKLVWEATRFAFENGADWVEGFPTRPGKTHLPPPFIWKGLPAMFLNNGFKLITDESAHQWVVILRRPAEGPSRDES
jgi:GNAT superfamily N-acetyltransferase